MNFSGLVGRVTKFASDNSPAILTVVGVGGTLLTAYLTGKATFRMAELIRDEEDRLEEKLDDRDRLKFVFEEGHWREYIPAAATALTTISSMIAATRIGAQRAAAMAAAYSISERVYQEYKDKVLERLGRTKEQSLRDEIAQDRVRANPPTNREIIIAGQGSVLCYDAYTGRYFLSSIEELKKAQNDVNYHVNNDYYASLTDFYMLVGLPKTSHSDEVGWNSDKLLELNLTAVLTEDQRPCISIEFAVTPIRDYYRVS